LSIQFVPEEFDINWMLPGCTPEIRDLIMTDFEDESLIVTSVRQLPDYFESAKLQ
jgi:hypothetical protein